jgi:hypothetical protein
MDPSRVVSSARRALLAFVQSFSLGAGAILEEDCGSALRKYVLDCGTFVGCGCGFETTRRRRCGEEKVRPPACGQIPPRTLQHCLPNLRSRTSLTQRFSATRYYCIGIGISAYHDNFLLRVLHCKRTLRWTIPWYRCWPLNVRFPTSVWHSANYVPSSPHTCLTRSCAFLNGTTKGFLVWLMAASAASPKSRSYRRTPLEWRRCLSKGISEE